MMRTETTEFPYTHVANRFAACGDLCYLGRKFRSLNNDRRRFVVELMQAGYEPEVAIRKARTRGVENLLPFFLTAKV